jgi:hypothetical protein
MSELQLDPDLVATLSALETHRVEFVLVGDVANAIYDHGGFVSGVAIVPGAYGRNVERLSKALQAMNAELGIAGRPDPRGLDWRTMDLRELAPCTFMTTYADVDLDFQPAGTNGYRDLFQDAERFLVGPGARPYIVSLDDLDRIGRHDRAPDPVQPLPRLDPSGYGSPDGPPAYAATDDYSVPAASPPPPAQPPEPEDYDLGIWTEEEFRAIRAGRIPY